jgi:hypothetical protein
MKKGEKRKHPAVHELLVGGEHGLEVSGAYVVNLAGAHAYHFVLVGDLLLSIVGAPAPFQSHMLTFHLVQGEGTPSFVLWPNCIKWRSGTPPTLSTERSKRDMIRLETPDYGYTWHDTIIGIGYSAGDAV